MTVDASIAAPPRRTARTRRAWASLLTAGAAACFGAPKPEAECLIGAGQSLRSEAPTRWKTAAEAQPIDSTAGVPDFWEPGRGTVLFTGPDTDGRETGWLIDKAPLGPWSAPEAVALLFEDGQPLAGHDLAFGGATDVDGDGLSDLLVNLQRSDGDTALLAYGPEPSFEPLWGLDGPRQTAASPFDETGSVQVVAMPDLDGDGYGDLARFSGSRMSLYAGGAVRESVGALDPFAAMEDFSARNPRVVTDVSGDGVPDIVLSNTFCCFWAYAGPFKGVVGSDDAYTTDVPPEGIDYYGLGYVQGATRLLAVDSSANGASFLGVTANFINTEDLELYSLPLASRYVGASTGREVAVVSAPLEGPLLTDLDGNGRDDLAWLAVAKSGHRNEPYAVNVWEDANARSSVRLLMPAPDERFEHVSAADLDGDGCVDLAITAEPAEGEPGERAWFELSPGQKVDP